LLSLFGWIAGLLAGLSPWIPVAALAAIAGLIAIIAFRSTEAGHGSTTEVAALTTFMLGLLIHQSRELAAALGLATTLLLISKPWVRSLVPRLRRMDLTSTLQLAIFLAVVLPILPERPPDPWGVLSPRKIGIFVGLIAGIGYVGYILNRWLGNRRAAG